MIGGLVLVLGVVLTPIQPASAALPCPTVIAHRGNTAAGGPTESSIGAFQATFGTGSKWIETDVRFTKDAVPVLMHDSTVDRTTTGTGYVANLTAAQFAALRMNDGQSPPTLDQALGLLRDNPDRRLIMEVKAMTSSQDQILLDKLSGLESQVYVNAFAAQLASIQRLKAANPLLQISMATYSPVLPPPPGLSGEDMEFTYVTAERVQELHAAGMIVRAWVSNGPTGWQALRNVGVDAIMTDQTSAYMRWAAVECPAVPPEPTEPTEPPDETPPTVSQSAPGDGAEVSGTVQVTGAASDDVGVDTVSLLVDGATVASAPGGPAGAVALSWDSVTVANGTHTLRLQARDEAGNIGQSDVVSVTVQNEDQADVTPPSAPSGLARTISGFSVRLTWAASTDNVGVTGYTVYRSGVAIGTTTTATTYTDSAAPPGRTHTYTVRASDAADNTSAASTGVSATLPADRTAPTSPTGLRATPGATGTRQITLTWNASTDNAGVTNYYLFRGNSKYRLLGKVLTFTNTGLTAGTSYTYKVYAIDASGNWSGASGKISARAR